MEVGCYVDRGIDSECFINLWDAAGSGAIIKAIGAHYIVHKWRLASGGAESATGMRKVRADVKDPGERREV